jgi:Holliday junction DNA helicase RuvA
MIGRLNGILLEKYPPYLLLEVNGVAYEIEASMNTFYQLPEASQTVTLFTHFVVREDAQLLFGFYEANERTLFRTLIKVNGVGPKLALGILSSMPAAEFMQCIADQDSLKLVKIPGVGKKTADRLMIELRDKIQEWNVNSSQKDLELIPSSNPKRMEQDAISALIGLGYKPQEASRMVSRIEDKDLPIEKIIQLALKAALK